MTRFDFEISEIVLRDLPPEYAEGLGALIEERLSLLASGAMSGLAPQQIGSQGDLADLVASQVWSRHVASAPTRPTGFASAPTRPTGFASAPTRPTGVRDD